jgi:hypothetical protein
MRPDELERRLRERLDAHVLGPAPHAELLHVLMLPDLDRADRIGSYWGGSVDPRLRRTTYRLRGDRTLRAVLVGMLRESEGRQLSGRKDGGTMNRLMRVALPTFVVSLVVWGLIAVWDEDPRALSSWTRQRIAVDVAVVSGLVMLALLVHVAWERLSR